IVRAWRHRAPMRKSPATPETSDTRKGSSNVAAGDDLFEPADERGHFAEQVTRATPVTKRPAPPEDPKAHYHGHRDRLRTRFRDNGDTALADYEILELLLFRLIPRRDTKPVAKALL